MCALGVLRFMCALGGVERDVFAGGVEVHVCARMLRGCVHWGC